MGTQVKTYLQTCLEELGRRTFPILTRKTEAQSPYLVGSAILYQSAGLSCLVTARHVVDELTEGVVVTSGREGFVRFAAERVAFQYEPGVNPDYDICIIPVSDGVLQQLSPLLGRVTPDQASTVADYDKLTLYAFVGYPHSKNKPKPNGLVDRIELRPFYYVVREFRDIGKLSSPDKRSDVHVAFAANMKVAKDITLQHTMQPPSPHGISGCGVWKLKLNATSGTIDQVALVGVGIEYTRQQQAFLATRFVWVQEAVARYIATRSDSA